MGSHTMLRISWVKNLKYKQLSSPKKNPTKIPGVFFSHPEVYPDGFNVFFSGEFQGKVKSQTLVLRSPHVERIPR